MEVKKNIYYHIKENGRSPIVDWISSLDIKKQVVVDRYIQRVAKGHFNNSVKSLRDGVFEVKIHYSSGLRVYFGKDANKIILLIGGDKKTQKRDIKKAKEYWRYYG
ncbi:MAG: type II toxin-antitoxin system RelE/ParE family toxin [Bdellovibrionales bacterium]|nr:type II toxin-antitoxin system RelE/ParE family toxin [Bdellovibrionales bacterium]